MMKPWEIMGGIDLCFFTKNKKRLFKYLDDGKQDDDNEEEEADVKQDPGQKKYKI